MMQRDEGDNLARWLTHYGNLFDFPNLEIMDNGSVDPMTIDLLKEAEKAGVRIYWGYDTLNDFHNKGGHFGNIVKSWDNTFDYDFALPLDCDEILAAVTDNGLSTDKADIHRTLNQLKGLSQSCRMDMLMFNVPGRPGWFAPDRAFHKGFLPARTMEIIDNGQHDPQSKTPGYVSVPLTYLHWHNASFEETQQRARRKMEPRAADLTDREALLAYKQTPNAPGVHLIDLLLMEPAEYYNKYADEVTFYAPSHGGRTVLHARGQYRLWDSAAYLAANPDVQGYELGPFHHYLRFGYAEGRALS